MGTCTSLPKPPIRATVSFNCFLCKEFIPLYERVTCEQCNIMVHYSCELKYRNVKLKRECHRCRKIDWFKNNLM